MESVSEFIVKAISVKSSMLSKLDESFYFFWLSYAM